jgi:hypothetical protein
VDKHIWTVIAPDETIALALLNHLTRPCT